MDNIPSRPRFVHGQLKRRHRPPSIRVELAYVRRSPLKSQISIRSYRTAFLSVVVLLTGVLGFTLWREVQDSERVNRLVSRALTRTDLIGTIRADAKWLESAVGDHIQAQTNDQRTEADRIMAVVLEEIRDARQDYTRDLPGGETDLWNKFNDTSQTLVKQVRTAVRYSNTKEEMRARQHLEDEIKPLTADLDELADKLSKKNAEVTSQLLRELEALRFRTTLIGALLASIAVVISLFIGVQVTGLLRKQETTIRQQMAELDSRNRELDSFASRVAHDLKSPLAPLKGYLTLIRRSKAVSDPEVTEMAVLAEAGAVRMAEIIEALLRFCRAGNPGESTVGDLNIAVSTILTELDQVASKENVNLERHLESSVTVACSTQLLQSIASNVLSNAIKYSAGRNGAKVFVRVYREGGDAVLHVQDNGMGMSEQSLQSLFRPFFRAPEAQGIPGHGLGLATTKRLVDAHHGTVSIESELGTGTKVTIRIPFADTSQAPFIRSTSHPRAISASAVPEVT